MREWVGRAYTSLLLLQLMYVLRLLLMASVLMRAGCGVF